MYACMFAHIPIITNLMEGGGAHSPKDKLISLSPSLSLFCTCNQMLIEMMQLTRTLLHVTIQSIDTCGTVVWIWWLYSPFIYMDLIWTGSVVVYARNLILIIFLIVKWQHKIMYVHKIVCEWQFHELMNYVDRNFPGCTRQ